MLNTAKAIECLMKKRTKVVKFHYFSFVALVLISLLKLYQSSIPLVLFMYFDVTTILKRILCLGFIEYKITDKYFHKVKRNWICKKVKSYYKATPDIGGPRA